MPGHPKNKLTFQRDPFQWLICECNEMAKRTREDIFDREKDTNIKFYGYYSIMRKGNL